MQSSGSEPAVAMTLPRKMGLGVLNDLLAIVRQNEYVILALNLVGSTNIRVHWEETSLNLR